MADISHFGHQTDAAQAQKRICAETGSAISILSATLLGLPVSTTHAVTGAVAGVGSIQRVRAVRWNIASNIVVAWVLTISAVAGVAALVFYLIEVLGNIL